MAAGGRARARLGDARAPARGDGHDAYRPSRRRLDHIGLGHCLSPDELLTLAGPAACGDVSARVALDPRTVRRARALARGMGCPYIATEHLVLSILEDPNSPAAGYLQCRGVTSDVIAAAGHLPNEAKLRLCRSVPAFTNRGA